MCTVRISTSTYFKCSTLHVRVNLLIVVEAFLFARLFTACECVKFELVAARYFQGNAKCLIGLHTHMLHKLIANHTPRPLRIGFPIHLMNDQQIL